MTQRYVIAIPMSAVTNDGRPPKVIAIPEDSVVDVPPEIDRLQGLIEVTVNGDTVLMFAEDIRDRAYPMPREGVGNGRHRRPGSEAT